MVLGAAALFYLFNFQAMFHSLSMESPDHNHAQSCLEVAQYNPSLNSTGAGGVVQEHLSGGNEHNVFLIFCLPKFTEIRFI